MYVVIFWLALHSFTAFPYQVLMTSCNSTLWIGNLLPQQYTSHACVEIVKQTVINYQTHVKEIQMLKELLKSHALSKAVLFIGVEKAIYNTSFWYCPRAYTHPSLYVFETYKSVISEFIEQMKSYDSFSLSAYKISKLVSKKKRGQQNAISHGLYPTSWICFSAFSYFAWTSCNCVLQLS